jgi:NAD(P)-dependent dehydrogenase (short-subunit alcohol dehydrogenase family)
VTVSGGVLAGRAAIVTGASRGIGQAIAVALAAAGADVALASRTREALEETATAVRKHGRRALTATTDVRDAAQVARLVARVHDEFGHVDILVNNAGVLGQGSILDSSEDDWAAVLETNLHVAINCTRAAGPSLVAAGGGKVINIASTFALNTVRGFAAYSVSKAALVQFTKSTALEWAPHGIQVNAVAPGYFATEMNIEARQEARVREHILRGIPARRFGQPEELGPLIVYLASSSSDYVTGATIVIDGGWSL